MQHYWDQEDRKQKAKKRDDHERAKRIKQGKINHRDQKDLAEVKRLYNLRSVPFKDQNSRDQDPCYQPI